MRELRQLYFVVSYAPENDEKNDRALNFGSIDTESKPLSATGFVREPIDTTHGSVFLRLFSIRESEPLEHAPQQPSKFYDWTGEFVTKVDLEQCPAFFSPK